MSSPELWLGNLRFTGLTTADVMPPDSGLKIVVTVNADFIVTANSSPRFRDIICRNVSTFDGQIVYWLAKALAVPATTGFEKISGSTLAYDLIRYCSRTGGRVFLLGAQPEINARAVERIRTEYVVEVSGYSPPMAGYPIPAEWNDEVLSRIAEFEPDVLLVALGSPKQEFWIDENRHRLSEIGVKLALGCGGTVDFIAGAISRAPRFVQQIGLEGLYRLVMQPSMFRLKRLLRSCLAPPLVLAAAWRQRKLRNSNPS